MAPCHSCKNETNFGPRSDGSFTGASSAKLTDSKLTPTRLQNSITLLYFELLS